MTLSARQTERRIRRHGKSLLPQRVDDAAIARSWCVLVSCVRNEMVRLPRFLGHYRKLGVQHFLFVDNASEDGLGDFLTAQPDCSWWLAEGSYKASNFGMDWCNHLLQRYGVSKWRVPGRPAVQYHPPACMKPWFWSCLLPPKRTEISG